MEKNQIEFFFFKSIGTIQSNPEPPNQSHLTLN